VAEVENKMFDGQEKATIDFDGDIKITAFNMEEEMQDGHFDKEGTFIFKKDKEMVKDSWLDNIDWVKIKENEQKNEETAKGLADSSDSEDDDEGPKPDTKDLYTKMLEMMKPGENILKCIKRLGGGNSSKNNKRDKRKLDAEQQAVLDRMIGYANEILSSGDMDIYQRTYEQLKFALAPKKAADMDMFADEETTASTSKDKPSTSSGTKAQEDDDQNVSWEFKWEDKDDAQIYGPYSSQDMLEWTQSGYFGDGVLVRKRFEPKFYSSKRIDFDLYI